MTMPETIWASQDKGMLGSTGRWVTQGTENHFDRTEYVLRSSVQAMIDAALATPPDADTRVVSVELLRNAMTEWSDLCDAAEEEYGGYTPLDRSYIAKIRTIIEGKDQ